MELELVKEFTFEATRRSPQGADRIPPHGRRFRVAVAVQSDVDLRSQSGRLTDYADIQHEVQPLLDHCLDHAFLNDVEGLEAPTAENISQWIWRRLRERLPGLKRVSVYETCAGGSSHASFPLPLAHERR